LKKQRCSRLFSVTLTICLCLGSLIILPMLFAMSLSMAEVYEIDFENNSQFEQTDFDEEFLVGSFAKPTLAGLLFSKNRLAHLYSPTSSLSPDSPPPKF
jgi:hypothetical protein